MQRMTAARTEHATLIAALQSLDSRWRTHGFRGGARGLIRAVAATDPDADRETVATLDRLLRFTPDLHMILPDEPAIVLCEVEVTHRLPSVKKHRLGVLGETLGEFSIDLEVLTLDADCNLIAQDWPEWYVESLRARAAGEPSYWSGPVGPA